LRIFFEKINFSEPCKCIINTLLKIKAMFKCDLNSLKLHLLDLKIPRYSTIIIHSSLFRLGIIEGGINSLMNCIREVFDESYTLAVPTFTFKYANTHYWSYNETKSETGILCEKIMKLNGTLRSIHPFHSIAAFGPNAEYLTNSICESSFGANSAFEKLYKLKAYNLSLGSEFIGGATFCHYAEELLKVPYRFYKNFPGDVRNINDEKVDVNFKMYVRIIEEDYQYKNTWEVFWEDALKNKLVKYEKFNNYFPIFLMNICDSHDYLFDRISKNPYYVAKKVQNIKK